MEKLAGYKMSQLEVLANQRDETVAPALADVQQAVRGWLRNEAGFAQLFTINKYGYPVGRTMGAPVDDDFTVHLVQRKVHIRIGQWRRNPRTEVVWTGIPAADSRNDSPHVYDFNLLVPRVVFIRGDAEFMDDAALLEAFERQTAIYRANGWTKAPTRTRENVLAELIGVRIRALQVRAEGFGEGATSFTWRPEGKL
jgi:hypothetical protein